MSGIDDSHCSQYYTVVHTQSVCFRFGEYTRCKRFASEEEVTVHLQQLNLSKSTCDDISTCYRSPRHDLNYDPSQFSPPGSSDPQNVLQPTNHSLLITALTGCPGLLQDESDNQGDHMRVGHVTRESERSPPNTLSTSVMLTDQLPWQQTYVCECTGQQSFLRDEQVITPLRLIDDTSSCRSNNWSLTGGDEVSPPLGAVRPQPESITGLTGLTTFDTDMEFPVLDQLKYVPTVCIITLLMCRYCSPSCRRCQGFITGFLLRGAACFLSKN